MATRSLDELVSEAQVCEAFGLKAGDLTRLRQAGLPFVAFTNRSRGYWRDQLAEFLFTERTKTLKTGSGTSE